MTELQELVLHLTNLKKAGHKEFNVNVDWLLDILVNIDTTTENKIQEINLDGGRFN